VYIFLQRKVKRGEKETNFQSTTESGISSQPLLPVRGANLREIKGLPQYTGKITKYKGHLDCFVEEEGGRGGVITIAARSISLLRRRRLFGGGGHQTFPNQIKEKGGDRNRRVTTGKGG